MASSSSVGVRQQLTSSSPETSDPKVDFAPPCPPNCKCCGFERPEMNTEPVIGSLKKLAGHAFVVYGRHTDWASDAAATDGRLKVVTRGYHLYAAEVAAEELSLSSSLRVSPGRISKGMCYYSRKVYGCVRARTSRKVKNQGDSGHLVILSLSGALRYFQCGPELAAKILAFGDPRTHVRLCSHVGGHKFAGNVIVYDMTVADTGDWYGYVTPGNVKRMLDHSARKPFTSGSVPISLAWSYWHVQGGVH
ncbi:hypothetical protein FOZ60_002351 [Perkinsus olseni]|uniref:Uncharacterized protein n=1 Tax=Perkinsus olseni TaxID=32597 RepID=A0A7J6PKX1_PEROL|nr:hypothetical protein FOZ60_002351 [Perkinsus olseni]